MSIISLVFLLVLASFLALSVVTAPLRPDARLTPGDVATTDLATICRPGYASSVRHVSDATKRAVYTAYGIKPSGRWVIAKSGKRVWQSDWEVDHLVSLEIGGSNRPANLWIESYRSTPYNAHMKDILEGKLHQLACAGTISLEQAQREIAEDWIAAYLRYVAPTLSAEDLAYARDRYAVSHRQSSPRR